MEKLLVVVIIIAILFVFWRPLKTIIKLIIKGIKAVKTKIKEKKKHE